MVGTPTISTFENTIRELDYHAEVLDLMCCPPDSTMVVHGGGIYGDKEKTINRWIDNYKKLPERVKRRLVLENCEKCFNIEDCLRVSKEIQIPVVFDTHHFDCYALMHPKEIFQEPSYYMKAVCDTWIIRGMKPEFHVSEQREGSKIGAHSDFVEIIPQYLFDIYDDIGIDIDLMVEAKFKEQAIMHLYRKYPQLLGSVKKRKKIVIKKPSSAKKKPSKKIVLIKKPNPNPTPTPTRKIVLINKPSKKDSES